MINALLIGYESSLEFNINIITKTRFVGGINETNRYIVTATFLWNLLTLACLLFIMQMELVKFRSFLEFFFLLN